MARVVLEDHTDSMFTQMFDDHFMAMTNGKTAEQASQLANLDHYFESLNFADTYKVRMRTIVDTYQGESRAQTRPVSMEKVKFHERGLDLIRLCEAMQ